MKWVGYESQTVCPHAVEQLYDGETEVKHQEWKKIPRIFVRENQAEQPAQLLF